MSDDVAAVLAEALHKRFLHTLRWSGVRSRLAADELLDALTDAGYAVVKVPEGVTVAHGAQLVALADEWLGRPVLGIEATP